MYERALSLSVTFHPIAFERVRVADMEWTRVPNVFPTADGHGSEAASIAPLSGLRGGQDVYAVSGSARRLGALKALSAHDTQWADATNVPARGHVGYTTARGGPVYDSLGHLVTRLPLLSSTLFALTAELL